MSTSNHDSPVLLTTLWENLVKIGARMVRHGRYITFRMAEVTVSRSASSGKS